MRRREAFSARGASILSVANGLILFTLLSLTALPARGDIEGAETPNPPGVHSSHLPAGMIRLSSGNIITQARVPTSSGVAPSVFVNWGGLARTHSGFGGDPPDPHGAVGPFGILQVINSMVTYASRRGILASQYWQTFLYGGLSLFPMSGNPGVGVDPKAFYDPGSGRFYVVMIEYYNTQSFVNLAVSKSSNPLTSGSSDWYTYRFEVTETSAGTNFGADYPCVGFDGSAIYVTCSMWSLPFGQLGMTFKDTQFLIFDKSKVTAGVSSLTRVDSPTGIGNGYTIQPASIVGSGNPGSVAYFGEVNYLNNTTSLRIWALSNPLSGTPTLNSTLVTIPDYGGAIDNAPQPAPGPALATLSARAQGNAFWYSGAMWFCHTGGGSAGRAIVYYYKVSTNGYPNGTPTLSESGAIDGGPGVWNYQPAIGGNARGEVCLVYTQSSTSILPTVMTTARQAATDAFPAPVVVAVSPNYFDGAASPARWGDYASVAVDPADSTFWVTHELADLPVTGTTDWATRWGNVVLPVYPSGWVTNGIALRNAPTGAFTPSSTPDGANGAFISWVDNRNSPSEIFVLRITATGTLAAGWPYAGLRLVNSGNYGVSQLSSAADGTGGAFLCWSDGGVRLQHVLSSGALATGWPVGGLSLASSSSTPTMSSDGAGGVFVGWANSGVYVQRVSGAGSLLWGANAVKVSTSGGAQDIASDGAGGAIISWSPNVRVQRVNSSGTIQWASGGISLATGSNPHIVADGSGGAIVAFQKSGTGQDVYAERITSTGAVSPGWASGGVSVCAAANDQVGERLVADGAGGAVLTWVDYRNDPSNSNGDIFAQRITGAGVISPGWTTNGVAICTATGDQSAPVIAADGAGGAAIAWQDGRGDGSIYAAHVSNEGFFDPTFPTNGSPLCVATGQQTLPAIAATQTGATILAWEDGRSFGNCNPDCTTGIFAQQFVYDAVPPAAVTNMAALSGRYSVAVSWTETGDDGNTGSANHFDLRYSTSPITVANFFAASRLVPPQPSGTPGTSMCRDTLLNACTTYYFAVKTYDEASNASALSNIASVSTKCSGFTDVSCGSGGAMARPSGEIDTLLAGATQSLSLSAPRPNPAHDACILEFAVPASLAGQPLNLSVFDLAGRRIRTITQQPPQAGSQALSWDLRSSEGVRVSPGVYVVRLRVGAVEARRLLVAGP